MRYAILVLGSMIIGAFCAEGFKQTWKGILFSSLLCAMWALVYTKWIWPK